VDDDATEDAADEFIDFDFFGLVFSPDLVGLDLLSLVLVIFPSEKVLDLDARFVGDLLADCENTLLDLRDLNRSVSVDLNMKSRDEGDFDFVDFVLCCVVIDEVGNDEDKKPDDVAEAPLVECC